MQLGFLFYQIVSEKDVQWSEQGMLSAYKFVQKFWSLHLKIKEILSKKESDKIDEDINKFTNQLIYKITQNLESFSYNVIIANMHETYNFLIKHLENNNNSKNLYDCYKKILIIFSPVLPHLTSECLEELKINENIQWPNVDKKYLIEDKIEYVIQINGKKRSLINAMKDIEEKVLLELVENDTLLNKYLKDTKIKKIIFVKNRLMNILV